MENDAVVLVLVIITFMSGVALGYYVPSQNPITIYSDAETHRVFVYEKTSRSTLPITYILFVHGDYTNVPSEAGFEAEVYVTKAMFDTYDIYKKLDVVKVKGNWCVVEIQ